MQLSTEKIGWADGLREGLRGALRLAVSAKPWSAAAFCVLSFALGLFWFIVLISLLATGGALIIVWIGVPILAFTMLLWIGGARLERRRMTFFFGEVIPAAYRPLPPGSLIGRAKVLVGDPAVWRDLLYLVLLGPIGTAEFVAASVLIGVPLSLVATPLYFWVVPGGAFQISSERTVDTWPEAFVCLLLGLALAPVAAPALLGIARAHLFLARWLLGPTENARLTERVDELAVSRSRAMEAMTIERRRIERDLHDGAQQRLVALAMDLGMAREKLRTDPAAAQALVDASHEEAKRVLAELRDLVRGIHPAVLTDRGLDAAISAIAGRSPVPVSVDVRLDERPPEPVETAAYFVVVEALTNVAKHSSASEAWVAIRKEGDRLVVDVVDNGLGGADTAKGSGLAGLRDRLAALDGRLSVDSRVGGPTWVTAELPWPPSGS